MVQFPLDPRDLDTDAHRGPWTNVFRFTNRDARHSSCVRSAVCQFGRFFASRDSAEAWLAKYPQGGVLTLAEALDAARRSAVADFGAAP